MLTPAAALSTPEPKIRDRFPTPGQYQEALQHPAEAFADPDLQSAEPRTGPLGLPRPITGAFAAVFPMTTRAGRTVAVKCFLSAVADRRARYRAVADHLTEAGLPHTIGFDYESEGIRVAGRPYPLLKMDWVEGTPLNRFVAEHRDAPDVLRALADAWAEMLAALEAAGFAHGDLQHGNVLVQDDSDGPSLCLVDYDTAFVPALAGKKSAEIGHRNYQHPDRTEADFGPYLDRFPGLAVFVALHALVRRPGLWDRYDTGENLLFRAADFYDPDASPLFADLANSDAEHGAVETLRAACHLAPQDVPPLAEVRSGTASVESPPSSPGRRGRRKQNRREGGARWFAPVLIGGSVVAAALAVSGALWAAGLVLLLGSGIGGAWGVRSYRRRPVVRRRRRLQQEADRFTERVTALRREEKTLAEQRRDVVGRRAERQAERLAEVREEALERHLRHHFIGEVRAVEGLSHKTVVRLKADGIRTAYEATPEALAGVRKLGEKSTARLNRWRAALAERYADDVPDALSPAEERRLERFTERRLEQIDAETARVRRKIEAQEAERADAQARAAALPGLSGMRYLRYLLYLETTLPSLEQAVRPVPPAVPPKRTGPRRAEPASSPAQEERREAAWYE